MRNPITVAFLKRLLDVSRDDRFLGREIVVERPFSDIGLVSDLLHCGSFEALLPEQIDCNRHDLASRFLFAAFHAAF